MIDFTALGLRIQIVDKDKRPMFDLGSPKLLPYSVDALKGLAPILDKVPNKISITGHTTPIPTGPVLPIPTGNYRLIAPMPPAAP